MLASRPQPMSVEAFLAWARHRTERYELVRGEPLRLMTGAKQSHNVVVGNIADALRRAAKAQGCRTTTSDTAVATSERSVRYPDIVVDCGPPDPDALIAIRPTILVEVLSPSTSQIDLTDKLEEYQALASVSTILLVDPDLVSVKLYRRNEAGAWTAQRYDRIEETVDLPGIGVSLSLGEIYDTLQPRSGPRLEIV